MTNADLNSELVKPEHIYGDLTAIQIQVMDRYNKKKKKDYLGEQYQKKLDEKKKVSDDAIAKLQPYLDEIQKEEDAKQRIGPILRKHVLRKKAEAKAEAKAKVEAKAETEVETATKHKQQTR